MTKHNEVMFARCAESGAHCYLDLLEEIAAQYPIDDEWYAVVMEELGNALVYGAKVVREKGRLKTSRLN